MAVEAATGKLVWQHEGRLGISNPAVVNGIVYASAEFNKLLALDAATGAVKWEYFDSKAALGNSPTVAAGERSSLDQTIEISMLSTAPQERSCGNSDLAVIKLSVTGQAQCIPMVPYFAGNDDGKWVMLLMQQLVCWSGLMAAEFPPILDPLRLQ